MMKNKLPVALHDSATSSHLSRLSSSCFLSAIERNFQRIYSEHPRNYISKLVFQSDTLRIITRFHHDSSSEPPGVNNFHGKIEHVSFAVRVNI